MKRGFDHGPSIECCCVVLRCRRVFFGDGIENLYTETDASNTATLTTPGQQGVGQIRQGVLEASNVEPVEILAEFAGTIRSLRAMERLLGQ